MPMSPMHPNPSCYWERQSKAQEKRGEAPVRCANIFHRDHVGIVVVQLRGSNYCIDDLAREIAERNP